VKLLQEELITVWQLQAVCVMTPVLSTDGIIPNKLLNIRPALYIVLQKAEQGG
jgi:hypothetical protein